MKLLSILVAGTGLMLATAACESKKEAPAPSGSKPAPSSASLASAQPSAAQSSPGAASSGASSASAAAPSGSDKAEVEIIGTVGSKVPAARYKIFVSPKPCKELGGVVGDAATVNKPGDFFLEIFVPQGSQGYICGVGLDAKGQIVAIGSHSGNPVTMKGVGEVMFTGVNLLLDPMGKPVPAPPGL